MPVKYLTSVRPDAGKADSVLMGMKGIRFAAMEEPDDGCKINAPLAAELTGGSTISGRDLFCANMEYRPQMVPNSACNKLPAIQNNYGGGRNRIRNYDYESRFVVGAACTRRTTCTQHILRSITGFSSGRWTACHEPVAKIGRAVSGTCDSGKMTVA